MPKQTSLQIRGDTWQKLQALERAAPKQVLPVLEEAMYDLCDTVQRGLAEYPPPRRAPLPAIYRLPHLRNGYPTGTMYWSKFKAFDDRRGFFYHLKQGHIQIPYKRKRSAGLRGALSTAVAVESDGVTGIVGVNEDFAPYARLVIGNDDEQAEYHKDHWPQFEKKAPALAEEHIDAAVDRALDKIIDRLI